MSSFRYQAVNSDGVQLEGMIAAPDEREAQRELKRRNLTPLAIKPAEEVQARVKRGRASVSRRGQITVLSELATLLEAGLPIADALTALADGVERPGMAHGLAEIARRLKRGDRIPPAFRAGLPGLPEFAYLLIEAGDQTGQLAQALKDAVQQLDYQERVRQDLRQALTYPLFLVGAGVAAVIFILTVVVPRFSAMVGARFNELPYISQVVMTAGQFIHDNWLWLLIAAASGAAGIALALRQPATRMALLELAIRIPIIGPWLLSVETARWANVLATLLANRVPLLTALDLAAMSVDARSLAERLDQVKRVVRGGTALSRALTDYTPFDAAAIGLVKVGERAGNLAQMLTSLGKMLDDQSRARMKRVLALIEPAAIVIIGGVIGVFVTAIILAITSVNTLPL
ncbi:MAG: type II secretion system F family protein [Proteobacteria bacterium]|nr:type II secretion system F family protein [Pseudomonadota bacterium]